LHENTYRSYSKLKYEEVLWAVNRQNILEQSVDIRLLKMLNDGKNTGDASEQIADKEAVSKRVHLRDGNALFTQAKLLELLVELLVSLIRVMM